MAFPVADCFIVAAEEALGRRLPEPLRTRLARSNGGDIEAGDDEWRLHPVRDDSDRKRLARSANDISRETEIARRWPHFPPDAIAVATNGSGDVLVLIPQSDDVHLWDHETGAISAVAVDLN